MDKTEKHFILNQFRLRVYQREGQVFEDFFYEVMRANNPKLQKVKPHGNIGDRKNDGFDKEQGIYYQVFAPADIAKKKTISDALKKLETDFLGLYDYWNEISPLKEFFFVINDKYKGAPPTLFKLLSELEKKYKVTCTFFGTKDLEDVFKALPDDEVTSIMGYPPNISNIQNVDFDAMKKVVHFLLNREFSYQQEKIPANPHFNEKITFNKLSAATADLLKQGRYQNYAIKDYFKFNGFEKDELRKKFSQLYAEGKKELGDQENSDLIFLDILNSATPNNSRKKPIIDAVLVLMAYYFEYCDIFEEPKKA